MDSVSRKLKRIAFDLLASSVREFMFIDKWFLQNKNDVIELPYVKKLRKSNEKLVFETTVNVSNNKLRWFLKIISNGNGLLLVDETPWYGLDEIHTYIPLPPGKHKITVIISPKKLFGTTDLHIVFRDAMLVGILWYPFTVSLHLLNLINYVDSLQKNDTLRHEIIDLLSRALLKIESRPNIKQLLTTIMLFYEPHSNREEMPSPPGGYNVLVGIYGVDVINGLYKDLDTTPENVVLNDAVVINNELERLLSKLRRKYGKEGTIYICGHSHIDAAWLWDYDETKEKLRRTFSTVIRLLEMYDNIVFIQSSAQYYKWIEELDRDLFNKIKQLVSKGRWIIAGGTWVESDVQLITGESIARQFLYGQKYFQRKFNKIARIGWLPDTFGFPASLPQILRKSGIEVFVTHKVMWNQVNKFPHHSFIWKGIDGTKIPVQIIVTNYNEVITPKRISKCWSEYIDKNRVDFTILSYGYGDGGGGPTIEMIENIRLINKMPRLPYLKHLNEEEYINIIYRFIDKMPLWDDELYLEMHRGTYTTNTMIKERMYRAESAIRSLEILLVIAEKLNITKYPKKEVDALWEKILVHQFHDVLPGSSIKSVYDKAISDLEEVFNKVHIFMRDIFRRITSYNEVVVFNDLPWMRNGIVELDEKNICLTDVNNNTLLECQHDDNKSYAYVPSIPPTGFKIYKITRLPKNNTTPKDSKGVKAYNVDDRIVLENDLLKVMVNDKGEIVSIIDKKSGKEYIRKPSNVLKAHPDRPGVFDAWEVDEDFLHYGEDLEVIEKPKIVSRGPLVACIVFKKRFKKSIIHQKICLTKSSKIIDFYTHVNWLDKLVLLKTWFDFNINTDKAFYEIPFGVISRSTRMKSSWEKARFEAPGLRWVDVSDGEHGVAIISPSRHGYSIQGSRVGLSLLKSPLFPNPWSDLGEYSFSYHLYIHDSDWSIGNVVNKAIELWTPLKVFHNKTKEKNESIHRVVNEYSLLNIDPVNNVELSCMKKSEDEKGYVIRICNLDSREKTIKLSIRGRIDNIIETDIIEMNILERINEVTYDPKSDVTIFKLKLKPFEIKTLKITYQT